MIPYFPFVEASVMGGGGANIQPLTITQNGQYDAPAGVHGYNPVDVNVPDRYDEGYKDGYDEGSKDGYDKGYADGEAAVKAKIQSKTITKNGTYYASDDGLDGFDPVNVNVNVSGGFKLPDGVAADDFLEAVFGEADVVDETAGVWLEWTYMDDGYKKLSVTNGMARQTMLTMPWSDYLVLLEIDRSTGAFKAESNTGGGWGYTFPMLKGFGDPSHTNVAKNVNK